MKNFDRIKTAIQASSLESAEKMILLDIFAEIEDGKLATIATLFEKKGNWIERFNDNRKKKIEAFKTFNNALWQEIMEEEKQFLKDSKFDLD